MGYLGIGGRHRLTEIPQPYSTTFISNVVGLGRIFITNGKIEWSFHGIF